MKKIENNLKNLCIQYSDASSENDEMLYLMGSILLKSISLEKKECLILGQILKDYLNKKIILDNYFWKRSLNLCEFDDFEIEEMQISLKNKLQSTN